MTPEYQTLLAKIKVEGYHQESAHGPTVEATGVQVAFGPGEMPCRDNINYAIGYCEALQLLAGVYDPTAIKLAAPNSQHVLFTINMAYGPRVTLQVPRVIEALLAEPNTRRAVIFVGKPEDGPTGDQPCTTTIQFLLRDGILDALVSMRSWDLIKGLPYDQMMFTALNMAIARCIGADAGFTRVTAGSAHIYTRDEARIAKRQRLEFCLHPNMPSDWQSIRHTAQAFVREPQRWPKSDWGKHLVPPVFLERRVNRDLD